MKKILSTLLALPLALFLAFAVFSASTIPAKAHADDATTVSDNQFVDGNWFAIAEAKGEEYKAGSPTNEALNTQLELYQTAVESKDIANAEHYAIRSWVKANYAMLSGQNALEAGDFAKAKTELSRALKLAKAAQKDGAGLGEPKERVDNDGAPEWQGTSKVEGKKAETRILAFLAKIKHE